MNEKIALLINNIENVIIGKRPVIIKLITALLAKGHVLIEDVPGVGKTQLVAALSKSVSGRYNRVQFTPDVMPSDIMGFTMINPETKKMEYRPGSAFCNFFLADEINRASPKAQSSLLEIMEELQISVDGVTRPLPVPFMALATQNPVETYGTYHLPEAQMDRFIMKLSIGYPDRADEMSILLGGSGNGGLSVLKNAAALSPALELSDIGELREKADKIQTNNLVVEYIINLVAATRQTDLLALGASPRGSIALFKTAKALALINGRNYVIPDDIRELAVPVLAHRLILSPKGKSTLGTSAAVIDEIVRTVPIPA
ncbi:MAG: MoxR family ATPase [Oscillospiraceae bacterium]|jgi:MoxR-like ATPase|nr:MoxR family ATPase [Oscillospiraceae bacterium]